MGTTVTSTLGYGIRVNPEIFAAKVGENGGYYSEAYLDEEKYPLLHLAYEGISSPSMYHHDDHWVFIKPGLSRIYSGISGNGMNAPVSIDDLDPTELTEAVRQLNEWRAAFGHENIFPSWNMALWIN